MKFGLFFQVPATPPQTAEQRYRETIGQVEHADELGFHTVWLAEGHFRATFSVVPAPLILAGRLAGTTRRIRLGTASIQLPLHHPIQIAEAAAMIDVLSNGRLDLGLGRGSSAVQAAAFGYDYADRNDRFNEQMIILEQALTTGLVNHDGRHFSIRDLAITPRPIQQPAPPLYITANHPEMATETGQRGLGLLMGVAIHPLPDDYAAHIARYRSAYQASERDPRPSRIGAVFWTFVGRDRDAVARCIAPSLANNHLAVGKSFDEIARGFGIFGSPADCIGAIQEAQVRGSIDEVICHFNPGGLVPHERVLEAMTLFRETVMPAFDQPD